MSRNFPDIEDRVNYFDLGADLARIENMPAPPSTRFSIDEPDPHPFESDPDHDEEREREEDWAQFVRYARRLIREVNLDGVLTLMASVRRVEGIAAAHTGPEIVIRGFAEREGWSGVLSALARAMREEQG